MHGKSLSRINMASTTTPVQGSSDSVHVHDERLCNTRTWRTLLSAWININVLLGWKSECLNDISSANARQNWSESVAKFILWFPSVSDGVAVVSRPSSGVQLDVLPSWLPSKYSVTSGERLSRDSLYSLHRPARSIKRCDSIERRKVEGFLRRWIMSPQIWVVMIIFNNQRKMRFSLSCWDFLLLISYSLCGRYWSAVISRSRHGNLVKPN